ncbi:TspO/MBR family protein [Seonamhaeicola sp. ML3]|uniref:TspO/MBR family protein n=1 Tax=Seonamhaeicola sp. ML3 TaxID=2937786 RepID=UPI00200C315A|nr:TspO/MBR family protein [Seonamhaeicola sp. ML3]
MKLVSYSVLFLILNFGALAIGNLLMASGPQKEWYLALNKAPWTPPGWVFGVAWFTIMACFSLYMAYLLQTGLTSKIILLFTLQFVLNISWNYVFFNAHQVAVGLIVLLALTSIVSIFTYNYWKTLKLKSVLILPYLFWLFVATSLNMYILIHNK